MFEGRKLKKLKIEVATTNLNIEMSQLKLLEAYAQGSRDIPPEDDEDQWTLLGPQGTKRALSDQDQAELKEQVTQAFYKTPHGRNIMRLFEKYVAGRGFSIAPKSTLDQVEQVWKDFWEANTMDLKKKEIVRRSMRDGDCFLRFFVDDGITTFRFMIAQKVKNPSDRVNQTPGTILTHGIETLADDVETPIAYWYKEHPIPASEVDHIKILVDSDIKRGRSLLEPIVKYLYMYNEWLTDRIKLNKIRATVALVKRVKGTPTQAANIKSAQDTIRKTYPDGTAKQKAPLGVSVLTTNQNVEYDLKAPNLQASDVQKDGRSILLAVSAGIGLPEFMVSSDASNGNYASTMSAEGPGVMEFEDWQDFFAVEYKKMYKRVVGNAIAAGKIPAEEILKERTIETDKDGNKAIKETESKVPTSTECSITFPDIVTRDILKETSAVIMQIREELSSKRTGSAKLDLDYNDEKDLRKQERDEEEEEFPEGKPTEDETDEMEGKPDKKPEEKPEA